MMLLLLLRKKWSSNLGTNSLVVFPLLYIKLFWACCKSRSQKPILSYSSQSWPVQIPTLEYQLSTHKWCSCAVHLLLLLWSLGGGRSLSVDCLNSKIYMIYISPLIANPSSRQGLIQKRLLEKDPWYRLYFTSSLFETGIVVSVSCTFSGSFSFL